MTPEIYASDPEVAPDSEFEPGELRHLVAGNRGRLLDARRTPIAVTAVTPTTGAFEVELQGFEDAGARWELALEEVARFQFALGGPVAGPDEVDQLDRARTRFAGELEVACDPQARAETLELVASLRAELRARVEPVERSDVTRHVASREGDPRLYDLVDDVMAAHGVEDLERRFATTFVSNPASGEFVKAHAIVLAELGLCPYRGKVVRDPSVLAGAGAKDRRARHIVLRLALARELFGEGALFAEGALTLYRGAATDGPLPERVPGSFTSATFAREVAEAHFEGGPTTRVAVLWRQRVPVDRLFMTFLETREMNARFKEAEAVLIGDPVNRAF